MLVARSAELSTIARVFLNLLPSILAVTIPMAFLLGVLLAFGRMASDSEIVALRAVGVSPLRLLAPVMMLAAATTALTFYINAVALPAANQAHRQLIFEVLISKARTDIRPRAFSDALLQGQMILYVQDMDPQTGVWKNLLVHDRRDPREPKLILARTGQLVIDRDDARACAWSSALARSTPSSPPSPSATAAWPSRAWASTCRWTSSSRTARSSCSRRATAR